MDDGIYVVAVGAFIAAAPSRAARSSLRRGAASRRVASASAFGLRSRSYGSLCALKQLRVRAPECTVQCEARRKNRLNDHVVVNRRLSPPPHPKLYLYCIGRLGTSTQTHAVTRVHITRNYLHRQYLRVYLRVYKS